MKRFALILLLASLWGAKAQAANSVRLTQAGAGAQTGVDCANAKPLSYFNNSANWTGSPSGVLIGPGTTVHLCAGVFTGTVNSNLIAFQGDGVTGNPITLLFDAGAIVQGPAFGRLGNAGIVSFGHSHIVIDLGTNGIIQNTSNGGGLANHLAGNLVYIFNATDVTIQNGTFANNCVHQQGVDNSGCNTSGSDDAAIFIDSSSNVRINTTIHDAMAGIFENPGANDQNNTYGGTDSAHLMTITNCNWGIAIGAANTGNVATNPTVQFVDISNAVKWDEPGNGYHHNGIFMYVGQGSGHIDNPTINSVYIHGDMGDNDTSYIFFDNNTGTINNLRLFNFVLASTSSHTPKNAYITGDGQTGGLIANGTIDGNGIGGTSEGCIASNFGASGATIKNVICKGAVTYIWLNNPATLAASDFNSFFGAVTSTQFKNQAVNYSSLAQWQAALGFDLNSLITDPNLSSSYVPNSGSPVISTGANLTSLGIAALNVDFNGAARPSIGNWTRGAKNSSSATTPSLSMSPNPAAFGNVNVGSSSSPITVTVTSNGTATATLGSPVATFSDPAFSNAGTGTCVINQSLPVGSSCTIIIRFSPTAAGAKSGTMLVGANTSASINLSGTGIAAAVSISPSPVAFGSVTQGTTSSPVTVTVTNTGGATLTLATPFFVISGTNAADFARTGGSCTNGGTVAAAGTCTLTMTFHPATTAAESGVLTINGNATGTANLTGTGVAPTTPIVTVTPNPVPFGNQVQSTTSSAQTVTVTNTGSANLVLATPFFTITGANPTNFARAGGTCADGGTVTPSGTCTITVTFTPNVLGARAATLNILGNANGTTSLTGTGIAPATPVVSITPSPVAFGSITNGSTSPPLTVTVKNTGSATLTLNTPFFTITGTNASEFARTGGTCTDGGTVAVSGTCTLTMTFSPAATGARTATLNIAGNASGTDALTGTGQAVSTTSMSISPTSFDFGNVPQHVASATHNFTVTNTGTTTLTFPTPITTFGGTFAADWSFTNGTCISGQNLNPGQTCFKAVRGTPSTIGVETGTVTISATTASATANLQMTGTGSSSIKIAPAALTFPNTTVGTTSSALTETVTNNGTVSVTLSTPFFVINGTNGADFARLGGTCSNGLVLAAGVTCTVTVTFTPTIAGPEAGLLTVNSATATANSALNGTGVVPTPVPGIALSPSGGVSFGSQIVGTTSSAQTVTVSSTGTASLVLNTPYYTITGTNAADVTNTGAGSCVNGGTLAPGSTCTITLTFDPAGAGARTATLNVNGNASSTLPITGTGVAAVVTLTSAPNPVAFGNVTQSTTSAVQTVTITNTGNVSATLATPYFTITGTNSADFANPATGTCANGGTLAAAASCTVKLTFTPSLVAAETATLTVSTTGAVTTTDVLGGTGVAPAVPSISIAPDPANFGNQNVGTTSGGTTITITNSGTATLILAVPFFTITGTNSTDFARTGGTCIDGGTVATTTSCTIIVAFSPGAAGARTATLNIAGNANKSSSLTGTGVATAPILTITPNPVNYGVVIQGSSSITTLTVQNTGTASATLLTPFFSITGPNFLDFTRLGGTCVNGQTLAISATCSVIVAFTPTTNTAETATLSVFGTSVTGTATLNGTGQAQPNLPAPSVLIISRNFTVKDAIGKRS